MGILPTDILIKSAIDFALRHLRKNTWILDDIFGTLRDDPMVADEYGRKELQTAKEWFLSQEFPVLLQHRISDDPPIPCISIAYKPSQEMGDRTSLADAHIQIDDFNPADANILQRRIIDEFTPLSYVKSTGVIKFPKKIDLSSVAVGQHIVSSVSGKVYTILKKAPNNCVIIDKNINDDFTDAYVSPMFPLWNLHKELTFLSESYSIGVHTNGQAATTIWLWQVVFYSLLRYKEAYLDDRGFELSNLSSSALERDSQFQGENIFSKYIEIQGVVQCDWVKFIAPKLEKVTAQVAVGNQRSPDGLNGQCTPSWQMSEDWVEPEEDDDTQGGC